MAGDEEQLGRRRRGRRSALPRARRSTAHHRRLRGPRSPDTALSDDEVAHIHGEAVRFLAEHGVRILLAEARDILAAEGAVVGHQRDDHRVRFPPELVEHAVATAPSGFAVKGVQPRGDVVIGGDNLLLLPVGGPPFVSDLDRGRRPGTLADYENLLRLVQRTDLLHGNGPMVEPQDVPIEVRHLHFTAAQLRLSDKLPFLYTRGRRRVADVFELLRINAGVDVESFRRTPMCVGNVNINSPRQIDVPMALGIIDLARAGQPCVITPFTLAGAMAPTSLAGALLLQHLEVLAGVTLAQAVRAGAPVVYGGFTSNVDLRTGSPAFGTPEAVRAAVASGQLARHVGLPFRSSGSSTSTVEDAQGAWETLFSMLGAVRGGANLVFHSAGWQEGGLVASFEKFVLDVEMLTTLVESWRPIPVDAQELAYETIAAVEPGGHFLAADHTLQRFETAFVDPEVALRRAFEAWTDDGRPDARQRANGVWKRWLVEHQDPERDEAVMEAVDHFVQRRTAEGGAEVD